MEILLYLDYLTDEKSSWKVFKKDEIIVNPKSIEKLLYGTISKKTIVHNGLHYGGKQKFLAFLVQDFEI